MGNMIMWLLLRPPLHTGGRDRLHCLRWLWSHPHPPTKHTHTHTQTTTDSRSVYGSPVHLWFTEAPELWEWRLRLHCCFTSTETVPTIRDGGQGRPSSFTQPPCFEVLLILVLSHQIVKQQGYCDCIRGPTSQSEPACRFICRSRDWTPWKVSPFVFFYARRLREHTIICGFTRFCILILEFSVISPTNFHFLFFYLHIVCLCART